MSVGHGVGQTELHCKRLQRKVLTEGKNIEQEKISLAEWQKRIMENKGRLSEVSNAFRNLLPQSKKKKTYKDDTTTTAK